MVHGIHSEIKDGKSVERQTITAAGQYTSKNNDGTSWQHHGSIATEKTTFPLSPQNTLLKMKR